MRVGVENVFGEGTGFLLRFVTHVYSGKVRDETVGEGNVEKRE